MSPLNHPNETGVHSECNRPTAIPLMKFISSLDLSESHDGNLQAEQPVQTNVAPDNDLWSE